MADNAAERRAIEPHAEGRFRGLDLAPAFHPLGSHRGDPPAYNPAMPDPDDHSSSDAAGTRRDGAGRGMRWYHVVLLTVAVAAVTAVVTVWLVDRYLFPSEFEPVQLDPRERQALQTKLGRLERSTTRRAPDAAGRPPLTPEPYEERDAARRVHFTERELNALLARNTDLAHRVAIDLADDLVSARLLVDLPPDLPVLGGRTLRARAGLEILYKGERPRIVLRGVSVWGVPLPGAWLGGLKNIDLVEEYGHEPGFWKSLADGIDNVRVEEGAITVRLRE